MNLSDHETRNRRGRNYAMGAILLLLVALIFAVTMAKLAGLGAPG